MKTINLPRIVFALIFTPIFFMLIGCSDDDITSSVEQDILIDKYYFGYMHYPNLNVLNQGRFFLVDIDYDKQNRILRRNGGLIQMSSSSGYDYIFSKEIYDSVSYNSNSISVERKVSSSSFEIPKFKRSLFLNSERKVAYKVIETTSPISKDTLTYQYNAIGKIVKSFTSNPLNQEESFFYYNSKHNLDSITTLYYFGAQLEKKVLEVFRKYDSSINPLKNLYQFEETFYRSLSENNYSEYEKRVYDFNNKVISIEQHTWDFIYDENGVIRFDIL